MRRVTIGPDDLVAAGLINPDRQEEIRRVAAEFAVALTEDMSAVINPADPDDPIAAQFVPTAAELVTTDQERLDPIGDERWSPVVGIVHRYPDRVLLKPSLLCPVYCRFCFRREVVGKKGAVLDDESLAAAFNYIRERPRIWEVIVTGGDPFLLAPRRVADIVRALEEISHLGVIRFHTRVPIVDPRRVTPALVDALAAEKAVYVVIHANHPRELGSQAQAALLRLSRAGIPLLAQTVLLRGVNDDAGVLEALFRRLVTMRVKPYYLHHADLARGTSRFRTGIASGQRLVRSLRGRISGLCQPTYVLDIPGGHGKVPIGPCAVRQGGERGGWLVKDATGTEHDYPADPDAAEE
ncbi:MAG: lysine-2,3-aminomutase-like protein [Alphaproteobacteria bacterium]|nr:lysine-2,3-aminomutase-like protein [Alphaproteobacteria bacterium]